LVGFINLCDTICEKKFAKKKEIFRIQQFTRHNLQDSEI
jgi:hypothetical protein